MDNSVIVSLRDIVVDFDGQRILNGLNLDIHDKKKNSSRCWVRPAAAKPPPCA